MARLVPPLGSGQHRLNLARTVFHVMIVFCPRTLEFVDSLCQQAMGQIFAHSPARSDLAVTCYLLLLVQGWGLMVLGALVFIPGEG